MATPQDNLATIRDGYLAALAADAANPQPDYALNGKVVTRSAWRKGLLDLVMQTNMMINQTSPYRVNTVVRT